MLYEKNVKESRLDKKLFENPTSEYRATPFWAWNCELEREELLRQIDIFREMGFGGYHMHVRTGLATPYMNEEFMAHIKACVERGKEVGMLSWLYDEDRYSSGCAGGKVTKDHPEYRRQMMILSCNPDYKPSEGASVLARFDVVLNEESRLVSYRRLAHGEVAEHKAMTAYHEYTQNRNWRNGQADADTLNPDVTRRFIELTHEAYAREVGEDFGGAVPAIFTDEPYFSRAVTLRFADCSQGKIDIDMPYTADFDESYRAEYGESLIDRLPEILWERADGLPQVTRYRYFEHLSGLFARSYSGVVGEWCRAHGLAYTGHMLEEEGLYSQSTCCGEVMRSYPHFDIPGIDMLCSKIDLTTAKQCQSVVRQAGKVGMMCELDGVTGWDFDFRGHKLHGDWQAALGVTLRVPHLSWLSMKGEAKRDYPASISYQSPWYKEYHCVEDHFARVATALTRGKPVVRVGVIHPIESYWLRHGPVDQTTLKRERLESNFANITEWLIRGNIDFDFICESTLPDFCLKGGNPLAVGKMAYEAVVVPACETLRSTTLERLEAFADAGGKLIFMGDAPAFENAEPSNRGKALFERSRRVSFDRGSILGELCEQRDVDIRNRDGHLTSKQIHQLRRDTDGLWLFIAQCGEPYNKDIASRETVTVSVRGEYTPELWDTQSGKILPMAFTHKGGKTVIPLTLYDYESSLIFLRDGVREPEPAPTERKKIPAGDAPCEVKFSLAEPNVMLLDVARFSLDGGEWQESEELLRITKRLRKQLGIAEDIHMLQPWAWEKKPAEHTLSLSFEIVSEIDVAAPILAVEDGDKISITFNGEPVAFRDRGYYTDSAIRKTELPPLRKGINELILTMPFGERTDVENCYLLGDFGVKVLGRKKTVIELPETLAFDDICKQGLPFYGGSVKYHFSVVCEADGEAWLEISHFRSALLAVLVDGERRDTVAYPPYLASLGYLEAGEHQVTVEAFVSRQNCFGNLHCADEKLIWRGNAAWRTEGDRWTYEYRLSPQGIISTPIFFKEV